MTSNSFFGIEWWVCVGGRRELLGVPAGRTTGPGDAADVQRVDLGRAAHRQAEQHRMAGHLDHRHWCRGARKRGDEMTDKKTKWFLR